MAAYKEPIVLTCHVCGDRRPERRISFYQRNTTIGGQPVLQITQYCNDNLDCIEGATTVSILPEGVEDA